MVVAPCIRRTSSPFDQDFVIARGSFPCSAGGLADFALATGVAGSNVVRGIWSHGSLCPLADFAGYLDVPAATHTTLAVDGGIARGDWGHVLLLHHSWHLFSGLGRR